MGWFVPLKEAAKRRTDVAYSTIYRWALKGDIRAEHRDRQWYVDLADVMRHPVRRSSPTPLPKGMTRARLGRELRALGQEGVAKRYHVGPHVVRRWMQHFNCRAYKRPGRSGPKRVLTNRELGAYELRTLPDMIKTFDAMENPPQTIEEARSWVEIWQARERASWRAAKKADPDYADLAALSITPQYILSIVRTRKYRMRPSRKHVGRKRPVRATAGG